MKKMLLAGLIGIVLSLGLQTIPAMAQFEAAKEQACDGLNFDEGDTSGCDETSGDQVGNTVSAVINIASLVVGVVSIIMIIVGGLKYVTSQGDSNGTASAKNTVIYAVVGLIIVALAQLIVIFVVNTATNEPVSPTPEPASESEVIIDRRSR